MIVVIKKYPPLFEQGGYFFAYGKILNLMTLAVSQRIFLFAIICRAASDAQRFDVVTLRLFASRGFPATRTRRGGYDPPASRPRSGPSVRLTTAQRFDAKTPHAFA